MRCSIAMLAAAACAMAQTSLESGHWYDRLRSPYTAPRVAPVDFANSTRLGSLLRAGNLYLSLSDAIALAVENNLDVEVERFWVRMAGTDVLRTKGGGLPRGISLSVTELPPGVGGPASPLVNAAATGALPGTTIANGLVELTAITPSTSGIGITGAANFATGPAIPIYDPALVGNLTYQHSNQPETNTLISGAPSLIGHSIAGNLGLQQGFSTGTLIGMSFGAAQQTTNSTRTIYNPNSTSTLGLTFVQPLLRGFGPSVNRRFIRIAKNNEKTMGLVFRQQAIATVSGVIRLYDDLVSLIADVKVKEQTLALAQQLYENNRVMVEQGTLAPIELTRAQAAIASATQDLSNSRGFEEQQDLLLKNVLTKRGGVDPALRSARIIPTEPLDVRVEPTARPVEDLVAEAFRARPELQEAGLQIENSHTSLAGSRNELLPQFDLVANAQNAGLAGQANPNVTAGGAATSLVGTVDPASVGGLGTGLSQIFTGRYPTYSLGVQLTLPLRNRVGQADVARDELQLRQWEVRRQQLENQVRLEVEGAVIALTRSQAAYQAAVEARVLQERSLAIEQERFQTGLSTTFLVMQYQSFVAQARSTEVAARGVYAKARNALERALGRTLEDHNISFDEAYSGRVSAAPAGQPR